MKLSLVTAESMNVTWKTLPYPPFPNTFFSSKSGGPSLTPKLTISSFNWMVSVSPKLETKNSVWNYSKTRHPVSYSMFLLLLSSKSICCNKDHKLIMTITYSTHLKKAFKVWNSCILATNISADWRAYMLTVYIMRIENKKYPHSFFIPG